LQFAANAAITPSAASQGAITAPMTPIVAGISRRVFPFSSFMITLVTFPSWSSSLTLSGRCILLGLLLLRGRRRLGRICHLLLLVIHILCNRPFCSLVLCEGCVLINFALFWVLTSVFLKSFFSVADIVWRDLECLRLGILLWVT
jgi:hypothetical protein